VFAHVESVILAIASPKTRKRSQVGDRKEERGGCTAGLRRPPATASITMAGGHKRWPP
jgi:hypothetical protein